MTAALRPRLRTVSLLRNSSFVIRYFRAGERSEPERKGRRSRRPRRAECGGDRRRALRNAVAPAPTPRAVQRARARSRPLQRDRQRAGTGQRCAIQSKSPARPRRRRRAASERGQRDAGRLGRAVDQPLSRTPDSVTVIPGREIEAKQQFTLAAALRSASTRCRTAGPAPSRRCSRAAASPDFARAR